MKSNALSTQTHTQTEQIHTDARGEMLDVCTQKAGKGGAFLGGEMRVGEPCTYTYTPFKTSFGGVFGDWRVVSSSFRNLPLKALVKFSSNCVYTPVA